MLGKIANGICKNELLEYKLECVFDETEMQDGIVGTLMSCDKHVEWVGGKPTDSVTGYTFSFFYPDNGSTFPVRIDAKNTLSFNVDLLDTTTIDVVLDLHGAKLQKKSLKKGEKSPFGGEYIILYVNGIQALSN